MLARWRWCCQDKKDDASLGVGSTALLFGDRTKPVLSLFSALAMSGIATTGALAGLGAPFFLVSVLGGGAHLCYQLWAVDLHSRQSCMDAFVSNKHFGALVFGGLVADMLI